MSCLRLKKDLLGLCPLNTSHPAVLFIGANEKPCSLLRTQPHVSYSHFPRRSRGPSTSSVIRNATVSPPTLQNTYTNLLFQLRFVEKVIAAGITLIGKVVSFFFFQSGKFDFIMLQGSHRVGSNWAYKAQVWPAHRGLCTVRLLKCLIKVRNGYQANTDVHPIFKFAVDFFFLAEPPDRKLTLTSTGRLGLPKFKGSVLGNQF